MDLFYSKRTLNNSLVLITHEEPIKEIKNGNDILFLNDQNKIIGFNIEVNNELNLKEGRILLNDEIKRFIESKTNGYEINWLDNGFKVGSVIECEKIPETHLSKCKVQVDGDKVLDIVCGAKNAREKIKVVVATVGTTMPSGLYIKPSKLKGFDSNGMLCSQRELDITGFNEEGIIELDDNYQVGDYFSKAYNN